MKLWEIFHIEIIKVTLIEFKLCCFLTFIIFFCLVECDLHIYIFSAPSNLSDKCQFLYTCNDSSRVLREKLKILSKYIQNDYEDAGS